MSEDLTKLSGPELVKRARSIDGHGLPCGWRPEYVEELARRAEEDTRVWQRRLERERDKLRERVAELEMDVEGRVYGSGCGETLAEILGEPSCWSHVTYQLAVHLRELLDERKAIDALADRWDIGNASCSHATQLREVLNGKR